MTEWPEYLAVRALEGAFSILPRPAARAAGRAAGRLAFGPLGVRREVVERHLRAAFPDRPDDWILRTARGCYRHFGEEVVRLARMARLRSERLMERTAAAAEAGRTLADAVAEGRGAIVVTGHLGNWELAGAVLAGLGYPVAAVVKTQGNARVDRRLTELRRRLGIETVPMAVAGRRLPEALDGGALVALVADQDAGPRGVFVPFLGRPASTFRGPARLALRHDVPLLFGALVREEDGYRAVLEPVSGSAEGIADAPPAPGGDPDAGDDPEAALTRAWTRRLEQHVRARPEQYFWFHRRWKTRPDRIGDAPSG